MALSVNITITLQKKTCMLNHFLLQLIKKANFRNSQYLQGQRSHIFTHCRQHRKLLGTEQVYPSPLHTDLLSTLYRIYFIAHFSYIDYKLQF